MKTSKFLLLGFLALGLTFTSCKDDDDKKADDTAPPAAVHPVVGSWEAYDVSAVLAGAGVTGVEAVFRSDNTYTVTSQAGEADTVLEGTYATSESANQDGIYTITLTQTSPSTLTAEGIFKIYTASPDSMWYEVAQSEPEIPGVTPPTIEAGFGSTSGGAFGDMNIQKYIRK